MWAEAEKRWGAAEICFSRSLVMSDKEETRYALNYVRTIPEVPARLQKILTTGNKEINDLKIRPGGGYYAAAGDGGGISIFNLKTHSLHKFLSGHDKPVLALSFSDDGKYLASAGEDGKVIIWSPDSGESLHILEGSTQMLYQLAFSPDGVLVASGGRDTNVYVWNTDTGKLVKKISGHKREVYGLAFSPSGNQLLSWSRDRTLRLYDVKTWAIINKYIGHKKSVLDAEFSLDGKKIISGDWYGVIIGWDCASGEQLFVTDKMGPTGDIIIGKEGKKAVIGHRTGQVRTLDIEKGEITKTWNAHDGTLFQLMAMPEKDFIFSSGGDKMVRIWTFSGEKLVNTIQAQDQWVQKLAVCGPDNILVTGAEGGEIKVWSILNDHGVKRVHLTDERIWSTAFLPGKEMVVGDIGGSINKINLLNGSILESKKEHDLGVFTISVGDSGKRMITGSWDKTAAIWDTDGLKLLHRLEGHKGRIWTSIMTPDSRLAATAGDDSLVKVWDVETGKLKYDLAGHEDALRVLLLTPDSKKLISAGLDKNIIIWDLDSGLVSLVIKGHEAAVTVLCVSPDGRYLASGSEDNTVRIWDISSGKQISVMSGHKNWIRYVKFTSDGKYLMSAENGKTIITWETQTGSVVSVFDKITDDIRTVYMRSDDHVAVVGARDKTIKAFSLLTGQLLHSMKGHPGSVEKVAFYDSNTLVSADDKGNVLIWPFPDLTLKTSPPELYSITEKETGLTLDGMDVVPWSPGKVTAQ